MTPAHTETGRSDPREPDARRTAILIVGMHRSGTSAVTRVLNLHGAALGPQLLAPAADNPEGFWEHADVVTLHERLLADLGRSWKDPRPLPTGWADSPAAGRARAEIGAILDRDFPQHALFAIKDPRLSDFIELWLGALAERSIRATVLHVLRHPDEIADSLHRRDGWPRSLSRLLWARSAVASITASDPVPRCLVRYDALLADWRPVIRKLSAALDLRLPTSPDIEHAVDAFLDPGSRHHAHGDAEPLEPAYIAELYEAMRQVAEDGHWERLADLVARYPRFYSDSAAVHGEYAEPLARIDATARRNAELERQIVAMAAQQAEAREQGRRPGLETEALLLETRRRDDRVVAYYRPEGQGYAEERSFHLPWPVHDTSLTVEFEIPADIDARYLRIDPSEFAGWFDVDAIAIDRVPVDATSGLRHCNGAVIPATQDGGLSFVGDDNDPFVELELPPALGAARHVRFDVGKRGLLSSFNALAHALHDVRASLRLQSDPAALDAGRPRVASPGMVQSNGTLSFQSADGLRTAIAGLSESIDGAAVRLSAELMPRLDEVDAALRGLLEHADARAHRADRLHAATHDRLDAVQASSAQIDRQVASVSTAIADVAQSLVQERAAVADFRAGIAQELEQMRQRDAAQAAGRQAVVEGLLEGLDRRLRDTTAAVQAQSEALASLVARLDESAKRRWTSRARRLIGLDARPQESVHDPR